MHWLSRILAKKRRAARPGDTIYFVPIASFDERDDVQKPASGAFSDNMAFMADSLAPSAIRVRGDRLATFG